MVSMETLQFARTFMDIGRSEFLWFRWRLSRLPVRTPSRDGLESGRWWWIDLFNDSGIFGKILLFIVKKQIQWHRIFLIID